jgi:hypothetical protein
MASATHAAARVARPGEADREAEGAPSSDDERRQEERVAPIGEIWS